MRFNETIPTFVPIISKKISYHVLSLPGKTMVEIARGGATVYSIIIRLSKSCSSYIVAPENQHNSNPRNIFREIE